MNSQEFSDRLQSLTEQVKPRRKTVKQIIRENIDTIEKALAQGWNYDDITANLNSDTSEERICITVATLRRYVYDVRKERENSNHN